MERRQFVAAVGAVTAVAAASVLEPEWAQAGPTADPAAQPPAQVDQRFLDTLNVRLMDDGLIGRGSERKLARELVAAKEYEEWFDFSVATQVLGDKIKPRPIRAKTFLVFDPDFVYQTPKLDASVTDGELSRLLAQYTERASAAGTGTARL